MTKNEIETELAKTRNNLESAKKAYGRFDNRDDGDHTGSAALGRAISNYAARVRELEEMLSVHSEVGS